MFTLFIYPVVTKFKSHQVDDAMYYQPDYENIWEECNKYFWYPYLTRQSVTFNSSAIQLRRTLSNFEDLAERVEDAMHIANQGKFLHKTEISGIDCVTPVIDILENPVECKEIFKFAQCLEKSVMEYVQNTQSKSILDFLFGKEQSPDAQLEINELLSSITAYRRGSDSVLKRIVHKEDKNINHFNSMIKDSMSVAETLIYAGQSNHVVTTRMEDPTDLGDTYIVKPYLVFIAHSISALKLPSETSESSHVIYSNAIEMYKSLRSNDDIHNS